MPVNQQAIEEAKKALRIADVYFRDEVVSIDSEVTPPFWPDEFDTQIKMVTRVLNEFGLTPKVAHMTDRESSDTRFMEVEFRGSVRCIEKGTNEEGREFFANEIAIGLIYEFTSDCSEDAVGEFVRMNVPFHAIPYWREHVHAVCASRRMRPITIPLYTQAMQIQEPKLSPDADGESST